MIAIEARAICAMYRPESSHTRRGTSVLTWMQTHGSFWKLDPEVEKTIIKYLAANYGPGDSQMYRRPPIPATLMPSNPYATEARLEVEAKKKEGLIPKAASWQK
jgi:hypothetical protein